MKYQTVGVWIQSFLLEYYQSLLGQEKYLYGLQLIDAARHGLYLSHTADWDQVPIHLIETSIGAILINCGSESLWDILQLKIAELNYHHTSIKALLLTQPDIVAVGSAWKFAELGIPIYGSPATLALLQTQGQMHPIAPEWLIEVIAGQHLGFGTTRIIVNYSEAFSTTAYIIDQNFTIRA